jgi:hypothetical protein
MGLNGVNMEKLGFLRLSTDDFMGRSGAVPVTPTLWISL